MLEHLIVRSIKDQVQTGVNVSAPITQLPAELLSE